MPIHPSPRSTSERQFLMILLADQVIDAGVSFKPNPVHPQEVQDERSKKSKKQQ